MELQQTPSKGAAPADDLSPTSDTNSTTASLAVSEAPSSLAAERTDDDSVVLIVHASVGSGHRSAAYAIAEALEELSEQAAENPDTPEKQLEARTRTEVLDILDFGRIVFDGDKTASMFTGWTRPFYDLTWRYTLTGRLLWGGGTIWARVMYPKFVEYVREVKPKAIVCTHITAANVAVSARMLTGLGFPIICVPTDYEAEGLWPHLHTDLFCVANEHMAETLRPRRVPEDRILITGIPASPAFSRRYDRVAPRERLGIPDDKQMVLALAGAKLPQPYVHFRDQLDQILPFMHTMSTLHLVIVAGADEDYAAAVRRRVSDLGLTNVTVLDYVNNMAELMEASDLVICKSGGLTVTECLCAKAPMILLGRAYGQEKANVRMLTGAGAAMSATTPRELLDTLRHIDDHTASADAMLINASLLRRPHAAQDIAQATFDLIMKEPPRDPKLRAKHFLHFYWGHKPAHTR